MNHDFFAVDQTQNLDGAVYDGVIGLSPNNFDGRSNILEQLYQSGLIEKRVFAINLGFGTPFITFGKVESMMHIWGKKIDASSKEMNWHPLQDQQSWSV